MKAFNKVSFGIFIFIWVMLWLMFIIRENKPGQYAGLVYLYSHHDYIDKIRYVVGEDFYDFLVFCKGAIPEKATYNIRVPKVKDIKEVQAMYYLWPLKMVSDDPDFKIFYNCKLQHVEGYKTFKQYGNLGLILTKEGKE